MYADDLYLAALREWGPKTQLDMVIEECSELIHAISKVKRKRMAIEDMEPEMVDVYIMLQQMRVLLDETGVSNWDNIYRDKMKYLKELLDKKNPHAITQAKFYRRAKVGSQRRKEL